MCDVRQYEEYLNFSKGGMCAKKQPSALSGQNGWCSPHHVVLYIARSVLYVMDCKIAVRQVSLFLEFRENTRILLVYSES